MTRLHAGLDVITDGEQTRLDFNLSFYGYIKAFENNETETENLDRRHMINAVNIILLRDLTAPNGLGAVKEFLRLKKLAPAGSCLKSKCTGPLYFKRKIIAE